MDFHSLSRRELQSLCKLNKIPANITNIAMADALHSLQIVEGINEFLKDSESSETAADLGENVEVFSPKARTTIRPKAKTTEAKTVTRTTTRRGSKQPPSEVEEPKNDLLLKTPALSRTTCKKAPATSSRRNVNIQLNECEKEEGGLVENSRYSTRRSTRLVEKTPRMKKGTENAVKIDSVLSEEPVEAPEETEVEDICDAFEKLDVLVINEEGTHKSGDVDEDNLKISEVNDVKPESNDISVPVAGEDVDCVEINNLKEESHEASNFEVKNDLESDGILSPCEEDENPVQKLDLGDNFATEHVDVEISNLKQESNETSDFKSSEVKNDLESDGILSPCEEVENPEQQKLDLGDNFATEHVDDVMFEEEHENLGQNFNLGEETCDTVKENSFDMVQEESVDIASLESGAADAELGHEDTLCEDTKRIEDLKTESYTDVKKDSAVSDDKENNMVIEKEKDDEMKSFTEISIRQLKKQLKALTLKNLNSKEDTTAARPALKALSDNQMMVGAGNTE
ncbi:hypothetical protein SSX86_028084 [Deinandra increscens subsp. villosa]|uniref:Uncharacterized protein n=1 Tax=Deinandra increscens subsp. villosa TaxID=3103831 RepID=A0AAP0CDE6_9ASTR